MRHESSCPISNPEINGAAFRVVDAQVDQDDTIWYPITPVRTSRRFTDSSVSSWMSGSLASRYAPPVSRLKNRRIVFVDVLSTGGKLYTTEKKNSSKAHEEENNVKGVVGESRVERESGVHLRMEATRSSSAMENACVIAIEPFG